MFEVFRSARFPAFLLVAVAVAEFVTAQTGDQVVTVSSPGAITGTVTWSGPVPRVPMFPINKDPQICDPDSQKVRVWSGS
jgi:hypothetical protein